MSMITATQIRHEAIWIIRIRLQYPLRNNKRPHTRPKLEKILKLTFHRFAQNAHLTTPHSSKFTQPIHIITILYIPYLSIPSSLLWYFGSVVSPYLVCMSVHCRRVKQKQKTYLKLYYTLYLKIIEFCVNFITPWLCLDMHFSVKENSRRKMLPDNISGVWL